MKLKKVLATLLTIATATTLAIHLINKYIISTSICDSNSNSLNGDFFKWKFGNIFYTKEGTGSPILLVHDLETYTSGNEWNKIRKLLAKSHTVYTIDLLGCGCSDKPNITYTNFIYVQLITDFIETIIENKVDLVTSSSSSSLGIMVSLYNEDIINNLILSNPCDIGTVSKSPYKYSNIIRKFLNTPVFGTFFYNLCHATNKIEDLFINEFYFDDNLITGSEIKLFHENAHTNISGAKNLFSSIKTGYLNTNILHGLSKTSCNIYILSSNGDESYKNIAQQYQTHLPSIEIIEMDKVLKYAHLETPELFTEHINILLN